MKLVIALLMILTCNEGRTQTKLSGRFNGMSNNSFSVKMEASSLNDYAGILLGEGRTDEKGAFVLNLDLKEEQMLTLFVGKLFFKLWARPDASLDISDTGNGGYIFSGTLARENEVLYATGLMQPYNVPPNIGLNEFKPLKQLQYVDSIESGRWKLFREYESEGPFSEGFASYCSAEIKGFSYFNKNQYPALMKASQKIKEEDIPADYFDFWRGFALQKDSTPGTNYQDALQNFLEYKSTIKVGAKMVGTEVYWQEFFNMADHLLYNHPASLQQQKTAYLLILLKYFGLDDFTVAALESYKVQFPNSPSIPLMEGLREKKQMAKTIVPSFILKDQHGNLVDIQSFRGKVVYIDFWGSWCKACLVNMSAAAALKEKLKDTEVVFLYLDFYDTRDKWLRAISQFKIQGIHLKAEKTDEAYFNKLFNISQGFPRYALLGKKGSIVTLAAPPPQQQAALDLIRKYLAE